MCPEQILHRNVNCDMLMSKIISEAEPEIGKSAGITVNGRKITGNKVVTVIFIIFSYFLLYF